MPRNFGLPSNPLRWTEEESESWRQEQRGSFLRDSWHANDNAAEVRWPYYAIGAAVVLMIAVGLFA